MPVSGGLLPPRRFPCRATVLEELTLLSSGLPGKRELGGIRNHSQEGLHSPAALRAHTPSQPLAELNKVDRIVFTSFISLKMV